MKFDLFSNGRFIENIGIPLSNLIIWYIWWER